jgi:hypothetical protein
LLEAGGAIERKDMNGFLEKVESLEDGGQEQVAGDDGKKQERMVAKVTEITAASTQI